MKKYYKAYDERYKTIHQRGSSWSSDKPTPIVFDTINKYGIDNESLILEIGCGEGRDANPLLKYGYNLLATDISPEAINYCLSNNPNHKDSFKVLDCLNENLNQKFDFIYAVAVLHMLVLDEDRQKFYSFINNHLNKNGIALICTMGDGVNEMQSDVSKAFEIQDRDHPLGKIKVAATSCRMVSFETFHKEIENSRLKIVEEGIAESYPDFNSLMYVFVKSI